MHGIGVKRLVCGMYNCPIRGYTHAVDVANKAGVDYAEGTIPPLASGSISISPQSLPAKIWPFTGLPHIPSSVNAVTPVRTWLMVPSGLN